VNKATASLRPTARRIANWLRAILVVAGVPAALVVLALTFERPLTGLVADQVTIGMLCRPIADMRAVMVELSERRQRDRSVKLQRADVERALGQGGPVADLQQDNRTVRWTINIGDQRDSTIATYTDAEYKAAVEAVLKKPNGARWLSDVAVGDDMLKACNRTYTLDSPQLKAFKRGIYTVAWSRYYYDRVRDGVSQSIADAHLVLYYVVFPTALMWIIGALVFLAFLWFNENIRGLEAEIRAVASGRAARLVGTYPREFSPLQEAFNLGMEANERAMAGTRQLVRKIAHDLNNGLAALLGVAEAAEADPEQRINPVVVRGVAAEMTSLIERYRSLAGSSQVEGAATRREYFDLVQFIRERIAGQEMALQNRDKRYNLTVADEEVGPDTPPMQVLLHKTDLSIALTNLLSNASRYGNGKVYVDISLVDAEVVILVEDNGPGIPEEKRKYIFDDGVRLEVDHEKPGSGFGLGIVRHMCALMNGAVTVRESAYGGACFELRLPAGPAAGFEPRGGSRPAAGRATGSRRRKPPKASA
jgi:signal transduction histidine kinase